MTLPSRSKMPVSPAPGAKSPPSTPEPRGLPLKTVVPSAPPKKQPTSSMRDHFRYIDTAPRRLLDAIGRFYENHSDNFVLAYDREVGMVMGAMVDTSTPQKALLVPDRSGFRELSQADAHWRHKRSRQQRPPALALADYAIPRGDSSPDESECCLPVAKRPRRRLQRSRSADCRRHIDLRNIRM